MSTRVQPIGQRSGFGIAADAGSEDDCVSALLRINTPDQLARLALSQIEARFECRALRLAWQLGEQQRRSIPDTAPTDAETALLDAALAAHGEVHATVPGERCCVVIE